MTPRQAFIVPSLLSYTWGECLGTQNPAARGRVYKWAYKCPKGGRGRPKHLTDRPPEVPTSHIHRSAQQIFMPCTEVGISSGSKSPIIFILSHGVSGPLTGELLNPSSLALPSPCLLHRQLDPDLLMSLSFSPTHEALNLACLPPDPPSFPKLTSAHECLI